MPTLLLRTKQVLQRHLGLHPVGNILRLETNLRGIHPLLERELRHEHHPGGGAHGKVRHLLALGIGHRTPRDQKDAMPREPGRHAVDVRRRGREVAHGPVQLLLVVDGLPGFDEGRAFQRAVRGEERLEGKVGGEVEHQPRGHVLDGHLDLGGGGLSGGDGAEHAGIVHELQRVLSLASHGHGRVERDLLVGGAQSEGVLVELDGQVGHGYVAGDVAHVDLELDGPVDLAEAGPELDAAGFLGGADLGHAGLGFVRGGG
mmetsp:Transcript_27021/g.64899  ORF Transcript_27021/g.64899 Transcript_27021/m.64899 type:complete len:259 (-) Transcript_27021:337-1113(-)